MRIFPMILLPLFLVSVIGLGCGKTESQLKPVEKVSIDEQENKSPSGLREVKFPKLRGAPDDSK